MLQILITLESFLNDNRHRNLKISGLCPSILGISKIKNQNNLAMRKLMHNILFVLVSFAITGMLQAQEAEYGMASYYGDEFHGSETASGEKYDKGELTAAHKSLPMGTRVRVTRMDTKKYVDVRINDRGPYLKGRIIDLSGRAADALGMRKDGTTQVKLDVIGKRGVSNTPTKSTPAPRKTTTPTVPVLEEAKPRRQVETRATSSSTSIPKPVVTPRKSSIPAKTKTTSRPAVYTAKGTSTSSASYKEKLRADEGFEMVVPKNYSPYGLFKIDLQRPKHAGFGVQVASLSNYENVLKQVAFLQGKWFNNVLLSIERGSGGEPKYKVILGPFPDLASAKNYQKNAKKKGVNGFVTSLEDITY